MLSVARSANLEGGLEPQRPRFELARPEIDDMRAALDWATEAAPELAAQLVVALELFWATQALTEGRRRTAELLALGEAVPPPLRAVLLSIHGGTTILLEHDQAAGEPSYEAALAVYRDLGDVRGEAKILMRLAVHAGTRGDADEARRLIAVARSLTEALDVPVLDAQALGTLGNLADHEGDLAGALVLYDRSADVSASCGFTLWETWMRNSAAEIALRLERYDAAEVAARRALEKAWEHGDRRVGLLSLVLLARAALGRGDAERAGRLWGAALAENEESGPAETHGVLELAAPLRVAEAPGYADALENGLATPLDTAVALALSPSGGRP